MQHNCNKMPCNMILIIVALLTCCAVGTTHVSLGSLSTRWRAAAEAVTLDPQELQIELGDNETIELTFKSDQERSITIGFLYDYGDEELHDDPAGVIAPLNSVTLKTGETRVLDVRATKPGHVIIVCNSSDITIPSTTYTRVDVERSYALRIIAIVIGWSYFAAWTISFYPQIIINFRRKSVVGLNFDYVGLNIMGHTSYAIFNVGLFWIGSLQEEYLHRHPRGVIPVKDNDVFFTLHAVAATLVTILQCIFYEREGQRMSWTAIALKTTGWTFILVSAIVAGTGTIEWLDFLYYASYVKLGVTIVKYVPQAYMNFKRKSTVGWSIWNVLLDLLGGILSLIQMFLIAHNHDDWTSIIGDPVKFGLGFLSIFFDIIFMVQHYGLYRHTSEEKAQSQYDEVKVAHPSTTL